MAERGQVFVLAGSREGLARLATESVDLLFLDGDHSLLYIRDEFLEGRKC